MTRAASSRGGGSTRDDQRDVFRRQAEHFERLGSPVYGRLAGRLAVDPSPAGPILGGDASWDLGLRLFGAVHYLVLMGVAPEALSGDWDDFASALDIHRNALRRFVRDQRVQTNETQRCVALVPAFLTVAHATGRALELIELGPSAGLNLVFDRYRLRYAQGAFGDPEALLTFDVNERGEVPACLFEAPLEIRRRRGVDLSPVDVTTDEGVTLLRSFLWPGLVERSLRLDAAIETLRDAPHPPELLRGDYVDLLPGLLADRPEDAVTVVFQTASIGYLPEERYVTLRRELDEAGADGRPLAWISSRRHQENETDVGALGWELEVQVWPEPVARLVGLADFHGNWIDWLDG